MNSSKKSTLHYVQCPAFKMQESNFTLEIKRRCENSHFVSCPIKELRAGDACILTGSLYTLRDAGHMRLLKELDNHKSDTLPYGLQGKAIFYAGPTPSVQERVFGAIGPTTSSRMDFAAPRLYDAGIVATIGKGMRSQAVKDACVRNQAVYFITVGGAAAYLAKCVISSEKLAYDDLGTEALRCIQVIDFPVFVGIDVLGHDVYELVKRNHCRN